MTAERPRDFSQLSSPTRSTLTLPSSSPTLKFAFWFSYAPPITLGTLDVAVMPAAAVASPSIRAPTRATLPAAVFDEATPNFFAAYLSSPLAIPLPAPDTGLTMNSSINGSDTAVVCPALYALLRSELKYAVTMALMAVARSSSSSASVSFSPFSYFSNVSLSAWDVIRSLAPNR